MEDGKCDICGAPAIGEIWEIRNDSEAPILWTGGFGFPGQTVTRYCEEHKPKPPKKESRKITDPYGEIVGLAYMGESEFGGPGENPIFDIWDPLTEWKTESPTICDWYWVMRDGKTDIVYLATAADANIPGTVWVTGEEDSRPVSDFTHWLGPIPTPAPPKG